MKPLTKKFYDEDQSRRQTDIGELSESSIMKPSFDYSKNMTEGISSSDNSRDEAHVEFKAQKNKMRNRILILVGVAVLVITLAVLLVIFLKPSPEELAAEPAVEEIPEVIQPIIVFEQKGTRCKRDIAVTKKTKNLAFDFSAFALKTETFDEIKSCEDACKKVEKCKFYEYEGTNCKYVENMSEEPIGIEDGSKSICMVRLN